MALINTPQSNKLKVVHVIGVSTSAIGSSAPTDGNLLMLAGEKDQHLGCFDVFCLPSTMRQKVVVTCPTEVAYQANLQAGNNPNSWHWFLTSSMHNGDTAEVMQLAVIPPFIVYDGFGGDVASEEIYEHILSLTDQTPVWVTHAKSFL
eukprot:9602130-Ditylum_brightwellii.AAC.1